MTQSKVTRPATSAGLLLALLLPAVAWAQRGPTIRTLTEQEMIDAMLGSSIQASRSSNTENMVKRVREAFAQGRKFTMISLADLPDDWVVANLVGVGGGGAWEYVVERIQKQNPPTVANAYPQAVRALEKHIGQPIRALIRFEPAGVTLNTFLAASELGLPVVDACLAGRAVPELVQQTTFINGINSTAGAAVTRWGDVILLDKTVDDYRVEELTRALAVASGGVVSFAYNPLPGSQLKKVAIPDDVSTSILLGRAVREARERNQDPVAALVKASKGYKLFQGIVTKDDVRGERGHTFRDVELRGTGPYAGHTYKVFVKNENLIGWLDGKPDAMSPDLICNLIPRTGDTVVGEGVGGYPLNLEVVLVSIPAHPMWRTPQGLEVLGPRHFGFDFDYVPIEELQKNRPRFGTQ